MKNYAFVIAIVGFACLSGLGSIDAVEGAVILVEPDTFIPSTILNTSYSGVTLTALGNYEYADGNVYSQTSGLASTGSNVFGSSWSASPEWGFNTDVQPHLRIDFDQFVEWVAIDAIGNDSEDYGRLEAYSSNGTLLSAVETSILGIGNVEQMIVTASSPLIAYVLTAGKNPGVYPHQTVLLDNLQYRIPEPASIIFLGIGTALLTRKRKQLNRLFG